MVALNFYNNMITIFSVYNKRFQPLADVALFAILILGFHFLFRFWAYHLHYQPFQIIVMSVYEFLTRLLFNNSVWVLKHFTNYQFTTQGSNILMGAGHVGVHSGCSGLKQFLEWIVLMTFFPGPWKHKFWFIPSGLIIIHLVNVFRISELSILLLYFPKQWQFTHDYIFRPFFYVVMFAMWVLWVEKYRNPSRHSQKIVKE
jgi:exosortase/archaeosortase family protein